MRKILLSSFLLLLLTSVSWAQERTISGKVTATEDGSPLPGVNVLVKGTATGTVTDAEGNYTLKLASVKDAALIFSFIGLQTREVLIGDQLEKGGSTEVNVSLALDVTQLGEVVVTGLGFERSAKTIGYSATKVDAAEITKGRSTSVMSSLQGKVAGVQISNASGAPGASTKVIIRGYSSLGGNNSPLYVVDGVPVNNGNSNFSDPNNGVNRTQDFGNRANDINPDDIAEITILKGASAASLYGSRASAGVIMITTKKGKAGDGIHVDFTSSATFSTPLRLPQRQMTFGQGWNGHFAFEENGSWGPRMDGSPRLWGNVVDDSQLLKPFSPQEDALKDFYDTGKSFINTVSINGGSEKSTYYLSYSNVNENGVVPGDNDSYKRNTLSFRGSTTGGKVLTSYSVNYVNKAGKFITTGQGGDGATMFQELIQMPVDFSFVDMKDYKSKFYNLDNFYNLYATNPYFVLHENSNDFQENRIYGNASVDYEFADWIKATVRVGGDVANSQLLDWIAVAHTDPTSPNATTQQVDGRVEEKRRFAREYYGDLIVSANKPLTGDLTLQGLAGFSIQERYNKGIDTWVTGLSIPGFYHLANSDSDPQTTVFSTLRRAMGAYLQTTLGYKDYLFLTLQGRTDWSSTLPKGANSFFYPSANLSFTFTDAFDLPKTISSGKLRAAIGRTGNDAPPYSVYNTVASGGIALPGGNINFPLGGVNAYEISNQLGNPGIKPEISTEIELGANIQFLNDRIGFDFAFYDKRTINQIYAVPFATTTGFSSKILNFGEIQNKGIELLINTTPVKTANFSWDLSFNLTRSRNKVLKLTDGLERVTLQDVYGIQLVAEVGSPLGTFYTPDCVRDPNGNPVVAESNGVPITSPNTTKHGNAQANYILGINNQLNYKGFTLSFGFDIRQGGLIYSYTKQLMQFVGHTTQTLYNDRQPFIVPNSVYQPIDPVTTKPMIDDDGNPVYRENTTPVSVSDVSTYWNPNNKIATKDLLLDRSYVKLREVALNYRLPSSILSRTPFRSVNVSIVGRNLLLWTPKDNNVIDPEITTFGNDLVGEFGEFAAGPTVRSIGFSIKGSF